MAVAEVAELLGVQPCMVTNYARRGILSGRKLGRKWLFLRPELDEAIRHLPLAGR
jgi:excisionase family DNA binding protein